MRVAYGWKPDSDWGTSPLWQANLSEGQTLKNASYHYLISDHLGTPQLAINSAGEQSWKINSDAFGNSELDANNQITMNLRFPGQYYDAETGLSYNYFRDYDAKTGRYIQSDPIGLAGGINTYGYVGGNPLVYSDPTGEIALAVVAGAGVATAGIRLCAANPACRYMAKEAIRWGIKSLLKPLPTVPTLNDNKIPDGEKCKTKDVEISDANIGGAPNPPDPDDKSKDKRPKDELEDDPEDIQDLIDAANKAINKHGLSAAARGFDKHSGRPGGTYEPLKGNVSQKNAAAENFVKHVLKNKNTVKKNLSRGGTEYRLPNGKGVRYNKDGSFSGVLDPKWE